MAIILINDIIIYTLMYLFVGMVGTVLHYVYVLKRPLPGLYMFLAGAALIIPSYVAVWGVLFPIGCIVVVLLGLHQTWCAWMYIKFPTGKRAGKYMRAHDRSERFEAFLER